MKELREQTLRVDLEDDDGTYAEWSDLDGDIVLRNHGGTFAAAGHLIDELIAALQIIKNEMEKTTNG